MFLKNRPIINVRKTELDNLIDWFNIVFISVYFAYVYLKYKHLPDIIQTHFNTNGIADGFGSKIYIWILPTIALIIVIGFRILVNYPHQFNYLVKITEENAPRQYQLGTRILRFTTLYILILFSYISYASIESSFNGGNNAIGSWFLPFVMISSILFPIVILIKMSLSK